MFCCAVQNSLHYYDGLEISNPIGSRATKKKLGLVVVICFTGLTNIDLSKYNNNTLGNLYFSTGGFCHCLGNISLQYHSSQNAIQLFTIVKQSCLKYYGINKILEPFMEDIKALENVSSCFFYISLSCKHFTSKNNSVDFNIHGNIFNFRGTILQYQLIILVAIKHWHQQYGNSVFVCENCLLVVLILIFIVLKLFQVHHYQLHFSDNLI